MSVILDTSSDSQAPPRHCYPQPLLRVQRCRPGGTWGGGGGSLESTLTREAKRVGGCVSVGKELIFRHSWKLPQISAGCR